MVDVIIMNGGSSSGKTTIAKCRYGGITEDTNPVDTTEASPEECGRIVIITIAISTI